MKGSDYGPSALSICATLAVLSGCGGFQPAIGRPGPTVQGHAVQTRTDGRESWMFPGVSDEDLLYVAGSRRSNRVYVFTYPGGQHVGTLSGLANPDAVCVDASQNVWISSDSGNPSEMIEYAHGKAKRRATLPDNYGFPAACSVDPKTGNLAVVNLFGTSGMIVYADAKGTPTAYSVANFEYVWGCAYDASGNLFASGEVYGSGTHVARLPAGGSQFRDLRLSKSLEDTASGLKWDGNYLDLGIGVEIYRLLISGSKATVKNTVTLLDADSEWGFNFFVDGATVVSHVEPQLGAVGLWNFPSGGYPTQIIPNAHDEKSASNENGIAVSKAMDR
ncbi:MAG: hypothetical protein WCC84_06195 [Candidatus Cybelea sp.]